MPTFKIYLKDKPVLAVVEADKAEFGNIHLEFKKDNKVIAEFRSAEVQGYYQESEAK
jgi:hypothetical protein